MRRLFRVIALINVLAPSALDAAPCPLPHIGSTKADVLASCLGYPAQTIRKTTAAGIEETLVYGAARVTVLNDKVNETLETVDSPENVILRRFKKPPP